MPHSLEIVDLHDNNKNYLRQKRAARFQLSSIYQVGLCKFIIQNLVFELKAFLYGGHKNRKYIYIYISLVN